MYPGYVPPKAAWHLGDTMQMPRITDADLSQQKDFIAPDPNKKKRDCKKKKAEKAKAFESQQHNQEDPKETQPPAAKLEKEHPKHAEKEATPVAPGMKPKDEKKPESKGKSSPVPGSLRLLRWRCSSRRAPQPASRIRWSYGAERSFPTSRA